MIHYLTKEMKEATNIQQQEYNKNNLEQILEVKIKALTDRNDFLENCISEMAILIYNDPDVVAQLNTQNKKI